MAEVFAASEQKSLLNNELSHGRCKQKHTPSINRKLFKTHFRNVLHNNNPVDFVQYRIVTLKYNADGNQRNFKENRQSIRQQSICQPDKTKLNERESQRLQVTKLVMPLTSSESRSNSALC